MPRVKIGLLVSLYQICWIVVDRVAKPFGVVTIQMAGANVLEVDFAVEPEILVSEM